MTIVKWYLKPRKEMAKENTKQVKMLKHSITSHAQNRLVERNIKKTDVVLNLIQKPKQITNIKVDNKMRPSYNRVGKEITLAINPDNNNVTTMWAHKNMTKKRRR